MRSLFSHGWAFDPGDGGARARPLPAPRRLQGATVFSSAGVDLVSQMDDWLGVPTDFLMAFVNEGSWASARQSVDDWITVYAETDKRKVWSIPLTVYGTPLADVAGGAHDADLAYILEAILADATWGGEIALRPGYEPNNTGWPWSIGSEGEFASDYVAAWRRLHAMAKGLSPRFTFDWNVNWYGDDPEPCYPGNAFVDTIGCDVYFLSSIEMSAADFWAYATTKEKGINWAAAFAAARGKLFTIPEWGTDQNGEGAAFIALMAAFIEANRVDWHSYFNNDQAAGFVTRLSFGRYPLAEKAFLEAFGAPTLGDSIVVGTPGNRGAGSWSNKDGASSTGALVTNGGALNYGGLETFLSAGAVSGQAVQIRVRFTPVAPNQDSYVRVQTWDGATTPQTTLLYYFGGALSSGYSEGTFSNERMFEERVNGVLEGYVLTFEFVATSDDDLLVRFGPGAVSRSTNFNRLDVRPLL